MRDHLLGMPRHPVLLAEIEASPRLHVPAPRRRIRPADMQADRLAFDREATKALDPARPKPEVITDPEGWIPHDGRACPVAAGTHIQVRLRTGQKYTGRALDGLCMSETQWLADDPICRTYGVDIVAYRVLP